jgi:hypothetical protein
MIRAAQPRALTVARRASAVLCVLLVLFISFVSVAHSHAGDSSTTDHSCAVCALAHAGVVPVEIDAHVPILIPAVISETAAESSHSLLLVSSSYIRPPPQA